MQSSQNLIYWGYVGIMEKKMETTIMGFYRDYVVYSHLIRLKLWTAFPEPRNPDLESVKEPKVPQAKPHP